MSEPKSSNTAERLVAVLLTAFFVGFGWFTLLQGGISLKGKSGQVTYVSGGFAVGVALGSFLFAAMVAMLVVKPFSLGRRGLILTLAAVLGPPIAFLLLLR